MPRRLVSGPGTSLTFLPGRRGLINDRLAWTRDEGCPPGIAVAGACRVVSEETMRACEVCNGKGMCTSCNGSGRSDGVLKKAVCPTCQGRKTCSSSHGMGRK